MIDNLAVLFSCTTVIWVVVRLGMMDREKKRAMRGLPEDKKG